MFHRCPSTLVTHVYACKKLHNISLFADLDGELLGSAPSLDVWNMTGTGRGQVDPGVSELATSSSSGLGAGPCVCPLLCPFAPFALSPLCPLLASCVPFALPSLRPLLCDPCVLCSVPYASFALSF